MTGRHTAIRLTSKCVLTEVKTSEKKKNGTQTRKHGIFTHVFLTAMRRERNFKRLLLAQAINTFITWNVSWNRFHLHKRCRNVTNNKKCDIQILILIIHEVIAPSFNCNFHLLLTTHKTFILDSRAVTSDTRGKLSNTLFIPDKSCYYFDAL